MLRNIVHFPQINAGLLVMTPLPLTLDCALILAVPTIRPSRGHIAAGDTSATTGRSRN